MIRNSPTPDLFLARKMMVVARRAAAVARAGAAGERETERWHSTRLARSSNQPSTGELMVQLVGPGAGPAAGGPDV